MGKLAPIAAAGIAMSRRETARRTVEQRTAVAVRVGPREHRAERAEREGQEQRAHRNRDFERRVRPKGPLRLK